MQLIYNIYEIIKVLFFNSFNGIAKFIYFIIYFYFMNLFAKQATTILSPRTRI